MACLTMTIYIGFSFFNDESLAGLTMLPGTQDYLALINE